MGTLNNLLVLATCLILTGGLGTYMTMFHQPGDLEELRTRETETALLESEVAELLVRRASTQEEADQIIQQWESRYKVIPPELETTEVIAYLNSLTDTGFRQFDIVYEEEIANSDYHAHVLSVDGRAVFGDLYRFVWAIENHRQFYRVDGLELDHFDLFHTDPVNGRPRMDVLVSFELKIVAYFGGAAGLSADDPGPLRPRDTILPVPAGELPPVPLSVLPNSRPASNPFAPLILEAIPPNTNDLPEIEDALLVSIADGKASFQINDKLVTLGVGDPVYLGQIVNIDPHEGRVLARLNKGGIIDEIEMLLETGERFREAIGPRLLTPSSQR